MYYIPLTIGQRQRMMKRTYAPPPASALDLLLEEREALDMMPAHNPDVKRQMLTTNELHIANEKVRIANE
jgi:hypothetical protein